MANQHDSFISEVTQELRRDRLAIAMRRYGWVVLALILLLVAGAAYREWSILHHQKQSQEFGDAILAATEGSDPAKALEAVPVNTAGQKAVTQMLSAEAAVSAGELEAAIADFESIAGNADMSRIDRDLASLKTIMLHDSTTELAERDALLTELTAAGAPFRLLALEQKAVALVEAGRDEDAATLIRKILQEQGLTDSLRDRLTQMMMVLGYEDEAEAQTAASSSSEMITD